MGTTICKTVDLSDRLDFSIVRMREISQNAIALSSALEEGLWRVCSSDEELKTHGVFRESHFG
jgi:hypothetical protein